MRMRDLIVKANRLSAWALIGIMAVYFLTGYGMTKGLIPAELSKLIHNTILPIPAMLAFAIHSAYGAHVSLKRWRIWKPGWSAALAVYVAVLVTGVAVFQLVLHKQGSGVTVPTVIDLQ